MSVSTLKEVAVKGGSDTWRFAASKSARSRWFRRWGILKFWKDLEGETVVVLKGRRPAAADVVEGGTSSAAGSACYGFEVVKLGHD